MAYDVEKYNKLRSLEVPRQIALALANDESPVGGEASAAVHDFTEVPADDTVVLDLSQNHVVLAGNFADMNFALTEDNGQPPGTVRTITLAYEVDGGPR